MTSSSDADSSNASPGGSRSSKTDGGPGRVASSPTNAPSNTSPHMVEAPFGSALEPALRAACDDKLSAISWFRTDWQRGGALTGYATWSNDGEGPQQVVVKLPVPPIEQQWLIRLQPPGDIVPRVFAHGDTVGPYDIAWLVMERLPHGPLGQAWKGNEFDLTIEALGRFYNAARSVPLEGKSLSKDWAKIIAMGRENLRQHDVAHGQRWSQALKKAKHKLDDWLRQWNRRPIDGWCHGDLHLANAMSRTPAPHGPALLLDFAQARIGHWVEDAVYFEHLFWARKHRLGGRKICSLVAQERKKHGLLVDPDWPRHAAIKRALLALCVPANLTLDGDPLHVEAALEVLEAETARA